MNTNQIAHIAQLVGEPARTAMLLELLDGRSLTANELARAGNVTAQTASRHLAQLVEAGLLHASQSGRHRYHRLASAQVAQLLESIMQLAARRTAPAPRAVVPGPKDAAMRRARTCYDHIAGRLGVAIAERLLAEGAITFDGDAGHVTDACGKTLQQLGMTQPLASEPGKRPHCRPCMDWSERRFHVAGRLGTLICSHCQQRGWLVKRLNSRALEITPAGAVALRDWLGHEAWSSVA